MYEFKRYAVQLQTLEVDPARINQIHLYSVIQNHFFVIPHPPRIYYLRTGWHFVSSSKTGGSLKAFLQKYL